MTYTGYIQLSIVMRLFQIIDFTFAFNNDTIDLISIPPNNAVTYNAGAGQGPLKKLLYDSRYLVITSQTSVFSARSAKQQSNSNRELHFLQGA
jgi:hypothetical protein